jgi:hypothetical protein
MQDGPSLVKIPEVKIPEKLVITCEGCNYFRIISIQYQEQKEFKL